MPNAASNLRRSLRRSLPGAVVALLVTAGTLGTIKEVQALGPNDRRLSNARTGIAVEAPAGWTLSQHTGYADTVVLLIHPDGTRISVSAATTSARTAEELYNQNRPGLIAQGLVPTVLASGAAGAPGAPRGSLVVDLGGGGRPDRLRQLYLVREVPSGRQAIVLTLVSAIKAFPSRVSALDYVASRLSLENPLSPSAATRPSGGGGNSGNGGSSGDTPRPAPSPPTP